MALIAAACLVGTLIVQEPYDPNAAIARYGRRLGLLIGLLGLNQLYGAWWFLGLLGLLALSVAVCTFSGARFTFRKICTLIAHASILLIVAGAILRGVAGVDGTAIIAQGADDGCAARPQRRFSRLQVRRPQRRTARPEGKPCALRFRARFPE